MGQLLEVVLGFLLPFESKRQLLRRTRLGLPRALQAWHASQLSAAQAGGIGQGGGGAMAADGVGALPLRTPRQKVRISRGGQGGAVAGAAGKAGSGSSGGILSSGAKVLQLYAAQKVRRRAYERHTRGATHI